MGERRGRDPGRLQGLQGESDDDDVDGGDGEGETDEAFAAKMAAALDMWECRKESHLKRYQSRFRLAAGKLKGIAEETKVPRLQQRSEANAEADGPRRYMNYHRAATGVDHDEEEEDSGSATL